MRVPYWSYLGQTDGWDGLTPTPANKLDRCISLSKNMVHSEIKQSDWWRQCFHDSPFSSEMALGFPIRPRHSPRPQCLSPTLAERLDEPLANMTRLMYDIGSRGSWDETCGVVEVAWCRDIKRAAKSCQVPYKPGDQSRGLDGPLDTDYLEPERLHCFDTLWRMNLDHSESSARTSFGKVSSLRKRLMGLSETIIETSRYLWK